MAQSPETQAQIAMWRQKARDGTMTPEDLREAIAYLRQDRVRASAVSTKARTAKGVAKAKKNINSDDLLGELDGL